MRLRARLDLRALLFYAVPGTPRHGVTSAVRSSSLCAPAPFTPASRAGAVLVTPPPSLRIRRLCPCGPRPPGRPQCASAPAEPECGALSKGVAKGPGPSLATPRASPRHRSPRSTLGWSRYMPPMAKHLIALYHDWTGLPQGLVTVAVVWRRQCPRQCRRHQN
jgi:hypothetical protein